MGSKATNRKHLNVHQFSSVLSSAVLEWLLMVLLFLNGAFSYLITKFAKKSKLQPPCVLCSRLDRMIGRSGPALYHDLLCDSHKMEMSSLAYCCVHRRLSNVHDMCQKCLFSSNNGEHRSSSGNLSIDLDQTDILQVPLLREDIDSLHASPLTRACSCCAEPLKQAKGQGFRLVRDTIDRSGIELIDVTKTATNREVTLEKDADGLPHVKYSELKNNDSNSELHTNDLNDFDVLKQREYGGIEDSLLEPFLDGKEREEDVISTDASTHENTLDVLRDVEPDEKTETQLLKEMSCEDSIGADISAHENTLDELCDVEPNEKTEKQLLKEMSCEDSIGAATSTRDNTLDELCDVEPDEKTEKQLLREMPCEDSIGADLDSATEKDKSESNGATRDGISSIEEPTKDLSSENPNPNPIPNPIPSRSGSLSLTDAYNFAIRNRATTSPRYEDVITGKDSSRVYEELKLLISQISAARGVDSPWTDFSISPRIQQAGDEWVLHNITKTLSLERSESMMSMEGSMVSEIEGESTVDRLKRQIDLDRKSISLLYKELEEERSASAIAANQAMAMMTRLQEEKAAMQMEALQYQRVMEEQAEYDQEALQKCNEIISQKQKYIEELEADLAIYREQPGDTGVDPDFGEVSSLVFEEQKFYISDRLRELEEKLHHFSNNSSFVKSPILDTIEEVDEENFARENGEVLKPVPVMKSISGEKDLVELEEEISRLSKRLKALEADHNFLEHSLNSLKSGQEGARFIREIAISLRDLRDLGIAHEK
ncbi:Myosin-binding protein 1 [Carex littledalei]|uniref:Myosin-binding protein 1 n=1 Tax=Carex littledalei TaxID=544730 RepID=A0A833VFP5_9POAL|nr:Myosin-binding protein 1 [Carex littledalei]